MSDRLLPSGQWLKDRLSTRWVGKSEIIYEEEIPSTNTLLKELARQRPRAPWRSATFKVPGAGGFSESGKRLREKRCPYRCCSSPVLRRSRFPSARWGRQLRLRRPSNRSVPA